MLSFALTAIITATTVGDVSAVINRNMPKWAMEAYGDLIQFKIKRNGKEIGEHTVSLSQEGGQTVIHSTTRMRIKFLFFTAYKFDYSSKETWQSNKLYSVFSVTNDDGSKSEWLIKPTDQMQWTTSNHWSPTVLTRDVVYNTITGNMNRVLIQSAGWDQVHTGTGLRDAQRFNYSGELSDVSAWYDAQNRWVALSFKGSDGSLISYECVECGK